MTAVGQFSFRYRTGTVLERDSFTRSSAGAGGVSRRQPVASRHAPAEAGAYTVFSLVYELLQLVDSGAKRLRKALRFLWCCAARHESAPNLFIGDLAQVRQ